MDNQRAFALRPEFQEQGFSGGSVAFGPTTQLLDIKAALDNGGGTIVSDEPSVIQALGAYPALQPVDVPADTPNTEVGVTEYVIEQDMPNPGVILQGSMPNPNPGLTASVPTADVSNAGISPPEPVFDNPDDVNAGAGNDTPPPSVTSTSPGPGATETVVADATDTETDTPNYTDPSSARRR